MDIRLKEIYLQSIHFSVGMHCVLKFADNCLEANCRGADIIAIYLCRLSSVTDIIIVIELSDK